MGSDRNSAAQAESLMACGGGSWKEKARGMGEVREEEQQEWGAGLKRKSRYKGYDLMLLF
jgi:hypothetical protein